MLVEAFIGILGTAVIGKLLGKENEEASMPSETLLDELRSVPLVPIEEVEDGMRVRVVGKVRAPVPLLAPSSQRPCAFYELHFRGQVEPKRIFDGGFLNDLLHPRGALEERTFKEERGTELLLEDATGTATLFASGVRTLVTIDHSRQLRHLQEAPALVAMLAARGIHLQQIFQDQELQFQEGVLAQNETIAVVGRARWEGSEHAIAPGRGSNYRRGAMVLRLCGTPEEPLLLSDHPSSLL